MGATIECCIISDSGGNWDVGRLLIIQRMAGADAQATWNISRSLAGACGDRAAICAEPVEALYAIAGTQTMVRA
jgi:hypothetical protein